MMPFAMHLPHVPLRDLPIATFRLVKETVAWFGGQDHTRWVFRVPRHSGVLDGRTTWYAKVWNPTYVRRDNILRALDAGLYREDTTPALTALIVDRGVCRGYLTAACRPSYVLDPAFYQRIKEVTRTTGLFNVQFSRYHVMKLGRRSTLIDLEGVYPVREVATLADCHCTFDDADYAQFVVALSRGEQLCEESMAPASAYHVSVAQAIWRAVRQPWRTPRALWAYHGGRFVARARPHRVHLLEL